LKQTKMHHILSLSRRYGFFLCMVASLCAAFVIPTQSQTQRAADDKPATALASGSLGSLIPERENTATGFDVQSPAAIDLQAWQEDSERDINWAWLALPALLGMLLITLRRRGGKEH
jgi:kynureninase